LRLYIVSFSSVPTAGRLTGRAATLVVYTCWRKRLTARSRNPAMNKQLTSSWTKITKG
jgi:hypothetical protein